MSFVDPDLREQWAKDAAAKRQQCQKGGHLWGDSGKCSVCGDLDPRPRVTLVAGALRAVYDPKSVIVVIEKRGKDAVGGERWECVTTIDQKAVGAPIFRLLTEGNKP